MRRRHLSKRRGRTGSRKLDLTAMREMLRDGRVHTALGIVTSLDGGDHYELVEGDLLVDVLLVPDEAPLTARMGALGGGPGKGLWWVPDEGSEVALLIPDGELEAGAIIVGVLSSGGVPGGIAPGRVVVAWPEVHLVADDIRIGSATAAEALVLGDTLKARLDALFSALDTHTHPVSGAAAGQSLDLGPALNLIDLDSTLSDKVKGE